MSNQAYLAGAAMVLARLISLAQSPQHLFAELAQSTTEHLFSRIYWGEHFNELKW